EATTLEIGTGNDPDDHLSLMASGSVGIGTTTPQGGKLDVAGDVLMGGGKGSKFIFHTRTHVAGDILYVAPDDAAGNGQWSKALLYRRNTGNLGIGGVDPTEDRLVVNGGIRILTDGNPIRFTSGWSGHTDAKKAEIANDTGEHKTLMILGNSSSGTRRVSVWDRLEVNGVLAVNGLFESAPNVTTIIAHDLLFGHPGRRGSAGRALVDGTNVLHLNYGTDWRDGVLYGGAINRASSRALKDDIAALGTDEAMEILRGLDPVRYHLKADETRRLQLGFIAEDVPEPIAAAGRIGVTNDHIVAVLTRVVKDQQAQIEDLSRKIEERSVARA
ncbi:MAG TPA: tail fiber domain-containing protein, partial [Longimicrobiaceae bacterium]|nr:tail fiber domain-containing protein [Longimicrobiaceae bacterium]